MAAVVDVGVGNSFHLRSHQHTRFPACRMSFGSQSSHGCREDAGLAQKYGWSKLPQRPQLQLRTGLTMFGLQSASAHSLVTKVWTQCSWKLSRRPMTGRVDQRRAVVSTARMNQTSCPWGMRIDLVAFRYRLMAIVPGD